MSDARARRPLDAETKVAEALVDHKAELRLWLRLLTCTTLIEAEVRRRLRKQFGETLPRFDLMAQLERRRHRHDARRSVEADDGVGRQRHQPRRAAGEGAAMSSGGRRRTTGARSSFVSATRGRAHFGRMAAAHEEWVAELLEDLSERDIAAAMESGSRQGIGQPGDRGARRWAMSVSGGLSDFRAKHVGLAVADGRWRRSRSTGRRRRTR